MGTVTPSFAKHGVDLGLEAGAQVDELGPIADELAQFAQRWWGDPGLGQASHAEQVDQVRGVALVVLHPPMPPVVAERMGQMHRGPALLDHVSRPVPPIGRFQYHLGVLTGLGQLGCQGDGVVVDTDRVERLPASLRRTITLRRRCRSMPTYCVCCSTGVSFCRFRVGFGNPKCAPHTWSRATGGLPRALRLCSVGLRHAPRCHEIGSSCCGARAGALTGTRHAGAALRSFITSLRSPDDIGVTLFAIHFCPTSPGRRRL